MQATARPQMSEIFRPSAKEESITETSLDSVTAVHVIGADQISRLSRLASVIVLVPRTADEQWNYTGERPAGFAGPNKETATQLLQSVITGLEQIDKPSRKSEIVFGDVRVNFPEMLAFRGGEPVLLTNMEFKMLKYLVQNARRVISRDELLNEVWGYENYPCTRTVDNHILRLRQKLEQEPSRPAHFHTVHGVGYKFLP